MNLLLNGLHLVVWFACLWLLLRFQWPHALGMALVCWLVVTVIVIPPLLNKAEVVAYQRHPPGRPSTPGTSSRRPTPRTDPVLAGSFAQHTAMDPCRHF